MARARRGVEGVEDLTLRCTLGFKSDILIYAGGYLNDLRGHKFLASKPLEGS